MEDTLLIHKQDFDHVVMREFAKEARTLVGQPVPGDYISAFTGLLWAQMQHYLKTGELA